MCIMSRKNASARVPAVVESARGTCSQTTFRNCTVVGVGCVEGCGVLVLCCTASPLSLLSINTAASLFLGRAPGCHQNNTLSIIANLDCLFFPASCNRRISLRMICCGDIVAVSCIIRWAKVHSFQFRLCVARSFAPFYSKSMLPSISHIRYGTIFAMML